MFSSCRLRFAVVWGVAVLAVVQAEVARGQRPAGPGMAPLRPAPGPIDVGGTIEAIVPGLLRIKSVVGQPYVLQLTPKVNVLVTGTAKADVLRPGSFVSFFAEVDKQQSEVQGKVGKLTLFTPSPQRPLGAFPGGRPQLTAPDAFGENPLAASPHAGLQPPGAGQPAPVARQRTRARRAAAKDQDAGPAIENFEIVGRITGIDKTGKLTVYAPNPYFRPPVQIELAEKPEIELDLAGPGTIILAKPGDKVQARGRQVAPNVVLVNELTIELAEPFTMVQPDQPRKKPMRRTTRSSRRKRDRPKEAAEAENAQEEEDVGLPRNGASRPES